jgi:hypothetical protein
MLCVFILSVVLHSVIMPNVLASNDEDDDDDDDDGGKSGEAPLLG